MAFSLNLLTLTSEADTLLNTVLRDKRTLEVRKQNMALRTENSVENSVELTADLKASKLSLDSVNAIIASLPEGERKEEEITKKMDLELKIRKLTLSGSKRNSVSVLENEYDLDLLDRQLSGIDAFIAAINARKLELN